MNTNSEHSQDRNTWSWADQISTYRFWGLALFYLFTQSAVMFLSTFGSIYFRDRLALSIGVYGIVMAVFTAASLFGFYLGWLAARWKSIIVLIVLGVLQIIGVFLLLQPASAHSVSILYLGAILFGLSSGGIFFGVPALLAGGKGGQVAFAVAFGILLLLTRLQTFQFVPFYYLYRLQGEAARLTRSHELLSPLGVLLGSFFVPFLYQIILTAQMDALNKYADDSGMPRPHRPWVIFVWSFFLPQVALGMLQNSINQLAFAGQINTLVEPAQAS